MRSALGIFGFTAGAVIVAIAGRYGFTTSDTTVDGVMWAFFYAGLALGAIGGPAAAVHLAKSRPIWGVVAGLFVGCLILGNLTISLGALAGRSDKQLAERTRAADARKDDRAALDRITAERGMMRFEPVTGEAVQAARDAVDSTERSRRAECGNGDPRQRGEKCRGLEKVEQKKRDALAAVLRDKAATDRAVKLDAEIAAIRVRLQTGKTVAKVNPLAETLAQIFSVDADTAGTYQQLATVVLVEILVAFSLLAWELLAPRPQPTVSEAAARRAGNVVSIDSARSPGDPGQFALACLAPAPGKSIAITDLHEPYRRWCSAEGYRPLAGDEFATQFGALCEFAGVKKRTVKGRVLCLDLALAA